MAAPLHRHQSSLEGILNFSSSHPPPLETELRNDASRRFHGICQHFDTGIYLEVKMRSLYRPVLFVPHTYYSLSSYICRDLPGFHQNNQVISVDNYSRPRLVRFTYEYSLSQESGDYFLRFFFKAVDLPIDGNEPINFGDVRAKFFDFAEYLFDNFFLPVKASTKRTPQPSPASHSAVQEAQGHSGQQYVGTRPRLSVLRRDCLIRDRHRCVISQRFDLTEAMNRCRAPGGPQDDDDNLIADDPIEPDQLEVAHILPHSLTKTNQRGELDASKQSALAILDMFDVGVAELIQGPEIDRPRIAFALTHHFHQLFGDFQVYFEPVPNKDHTYTIRTHVSEDYFFRRSALPITRELYLTPERTIEPPAPRLLVVLCAIAHILQPSGASEYIDKIYRDMEKHGVQADGFTPLGRFVSLAISE